ncbi:MAG: Hsp70 family protein [Alphaproteobacteria bacterium]
MQPPDRPRALGIDFGTTNTVVALAGADGAVSTLRLPTPRGLAAAFRSVLAFHEGERGMPMAEVGPWAIEEFLSYPAGTRLIQSFKSYAASALFDGTRIYGRTFQFEDLVGTYFRHLWRHAGDAIQPQGLRTIVGRPVTFAGADPDEALAMRRYGQAFGPAARYVYEPVAASLFFASGFDEQATILVGDFGGGTSDFSITRFVREDGRIRAVPLGHAGVAVAGDTFDYQIISHVISPLLGMGGSYVSDGKTLTIPNHFYGALARWNQLALMKGSKDMRDLRALREQAVEREALDRFVELLENDYSYALFRAVSAAKEALSSEDATTLVFRAGSIDIERRITRRDFERWIAGELAQIRATLDLAFRNAGLDDGAIDKVYLTGGSSFVPAVQAIFTERFGAQKVQRGSEFESIARGLALIGAEPDPSPWCVAPG